MTTHVHLLVDLAIREGQFDSFAGVAQEMTAATRKEPGTLRYEWYLSADHKRCRLLETYADSAAVLAHIKGPAVQVGVPKLLERSSLTRFEVYGNPGAEAAGVMTGFGAEIFEAWAGFSR